MRLHVAAAVVLSSLLAACGTTPSTPDAKGADNPYAGGRSFPWSDRVAAVDEKNPYANGQKYPWSAPVAAVPGLGAQGLGGTNLLGDLPWTSATSAWGPIERNRSNGEQAAGDGRTLSIRGQTFDKGLGVHANSTVTYALGGTCSTLSATVGIDDEVQGRGRVVFQVYGDGALLFDSGAVTGTTAARAISVNILGKNELRLVVTDGGDGIDYDHADWGGAKVDCATTLPSGDVYVSDLGPTSASNSWGPIEKDRSNGEWQPGDGRPLGVGTTTYVKGLGVHADSVVTYALGGRCSSLGAVIGIDDEVGNRGSVIFRVYADNVLKYQSPVLLGADPGREILVDLTGAQELKLVVDNADGNIDYDHADWANARLRCAVATGGGAPGTADSGYGVRGIAMTGGVDAIGEPDGSVVVLGADFRLTRLSPQGVPGVSSAPLGTRPASVIRLADGKVLALGATTVVRLTPDLKPDPTFGQGGVVSFPVGWRVVSVTNAAQQPDGKVVLVGSAIGSYPLVNGVQESPDFAVMRLTATGNPDLGFGAAGLARTVGTEFQGLGAYRGDDALSALTLQPDGKIVVVGVTITPSEFGLIARYLPDGQVDRSFGNNGGVYDSTYTNYRDVALESSGTLLATGKNYRFGGSGTLVRYTTSGQVLARAAITVSPVFSFTQNDPYALRVLGDGRILVGGKTGEANLPSAFVARYKADLTLDAAFGTGGRTLLSGETTDALNVDSSGRILATTDQATYRLLP